MPTLLDKIVAYGLYAFLAVLMGWVIAIIVYFTIKAIASL